MSVRSTETTAAVVSSAGAGWTSGSLGLMLLAGIAAVGMFATLFSVAYRSSTPGPEDSLRIALDEYVAGRFEISKRLAERVEPKFEDQPEQYRIREFLLGAAGIQLADQMETAKQTRLEIADAVPHLEALQQDQFPPGRSAEGRRLLGLGLKMLGRFEQAIGPLETAITEDPTLVRELLLPLAECKLRAPGGQFAKAIRDVDQFLTLPNLPPESVSEANLLKARILGMLQNWDEAYQTLAEIDSTNSRDLIALTRAEIELQQAKSIIADNFILHPEKKDVPAEAMRILVAATTTLEGLYHRNEAEFGSQSHYLAGIAYRLAGRDEEALGIFAGLRQNGRSPVEAIVAGLEEAELLAEMDHYDDALLSARALVREIGDPVSFDPTWISLTEMRARLSTIDQAIREAGAYAVAISFADALPPVVEDFDALRMKAESYRRWGESLRSGRNGSGGEPEPEILRQSREQFRKAGQTFEAVAELRFTEKDYLDLLWNAIDAYQAGRDFDESLTLLDQYLQYERRSRQPRGLIARGRALASTGRPEEALIPLTDCMVEFPRDSLSYEARLLAAIALAELGNTEEARKLLEDNVFDEWLSPESSVYRDSIYVLGDLLYRKAASDYLNLTQPTLVGGRLTPGDQPVPEVAEALQANQILLEAAIVKLEQAESRDRRFNSIERSRRAAYLAAEALRMAALWPAIQAADPDTLQSARNQLNHLRLANLRRSNERFNKLRLELLSESGSRSEMPVWKQAMLRNCFMGVADTFFEMEDYAAAREAYQKASQEFLNEPLALEALLQQSRCCERLGLDREAKMIYKQAAKILDRIPSEEDARFARTTRYDRADWRELLDWLQDT